MKECHTCEFHKEIMAGLHKKTPWSKTPCSTCPAFDVDGGHQMNGTRALRGRDGQSRVSLDFETVQILDQQRLMNHEREEAKSDAILSIAQKLILMDFHTCNDFLVLFDEILNSDEAWAVMYFRKFVSKMAAMDKDSREIVLKRIACKGTMKDLAEDMGISTQAAHARMKAAMRKHEWVAELITIKERKQQKGDEQ
jgi:hypothetical protein